ncbi:integrase/recombinase XerC [Deinococcus sp. UYEF24]
MSDNSSVFQKALGLPGQGPEQAEGPRLRKALEAQDLEACWSILSPRLPGQPGGHSQKNYLSAFKDFLTWAGNERLSMTDPAPHFGIEFQHYLEQKYGTSQASINTRLSQARRVYKIFRQLGVVAMNIDPFSILERSQVVPGHRREYYSQDEITRLLIHSEPDERVLILLGAHVGLTTAEVLALKWPDLSLQTGTVQLPDRQLTMSNDLYRMVQPYAKKQGGGALFARPVPVFEFQDQNALRARIYALCLKANVPYRAWRGLRHAAGLRLYRETKDLNQVALQMGVENPHLVVMYRDTVLEQDSAGTT